MQRWMSLKHRMDACRVFSRSCSPCRGKVSTQHTEVILWNTEMSITSPTTHRSLSGTAETIPPPHMQGQIFIRSAEIVIPTCRDGSPLKPQRIFSLTQALSCKLFYLGNTSFQSSLVRCVFSYPPPLLVYSGF